MGATNIAITEKVISDDSLSKQKNLESITLSSIEDILHLLKKIQSKHSLLTITIETSDECYGSTILEVNRDNNYLVLDELYPVAGHNKIEKETNIAISANHAGAFVHFTAIVEATGENAKGAYYKIPVPEKVEYHQRRNTFRITASISKPIKVNLVNEDEILLKAELRDISHGGVCLRVNAASHINFQNGDTIPTCLIQVGDDRKVMCSLNVCHVELMEETGVIRIGAEFSDMSKFDRRELEHFIASLEREIIKKIKRSDNRMPV